MNWETKKNNLQLAFADTKITIITILGASLLILLAFLFTDFKTLAGNMGPTFATIEVITGFFLALLFGINIGLLYYKLQMASTSKKNTSTTIIGGFFGLLVTGCPSCSITLASYLGLASILSTLPFHGLEIKLLGIALLVYSTNDLLKNLSTCKAKENSLVK